MCSQVAAAGPVSNETIIGLHYFLSPPVVERVIQIHITSLFVTPRMKTAVNHFDHNYVTVNTFRMKLSLARKPFDQN